METTNGEVEVRMLGYETAIEIDEKLKGVLSGKLTIKDFVEYNHHAGTFNFLREIPGGLKSEPRWQKITKFIIFAIVLVFILYFILAINTSIK